MVIYIDYQSFEKAVQQKAGAEHFDSYKCFLPFIGLSVRGRFLNTLSSLGDIPTTADIVRTAGHLPEKNFSRYMAYMLAQ